MNINNPFEVILNKLDNLTVAVEQLQATKQENEDKAPVLLNLEEAAQILKIPKSSVYYHVAKNGLPAEKPGKEWRFYKSEIIAWAMKPKEKPKTTRSKMRDIRNKYAKN